jgi:HD-GYP domain-containing protein (c-di-GMP phosphodiesterase class II)
MQLENDLYAIDTRFLIGAGHIINRSTLKSIAGLSERIHYVPIEDTWLMDDLIHIFKDKRYSNILHPPDVNEKIILYMKRIKIPEKILSELLYMKKLTLYTYHHVLVIAIVSTKISLDHSLKYKYAPDMAMLLSLFHDLGKTRIPLSILDKRTPVTIQERHLLKAHPLIGYILLHYYFGKDYKEYGFASFQHHERLDGSGYPMGIKRLNKYSQLIGVVDTLDALISERPYRSRPFTLRAAIDHLLGEAEKGKFNKNFVYTLVRYSRKEPSGTKLVLSKKGRDKEPDENSYGKISES